MTVEELEAKLEAVTKERDALLQEKARNWGRSRGESEHTDHIFDRMLAKRDSLMARIVELEAQVPVDQ